ncbi:MAG: MotA/TolQ/ExbB proton channel family protein [Proteobacteria bacterium]|nr:MotA/TolQ/ExbB proton channel family protein [Pseudomonadota bacterium]
MFGSISQTFEYLSKGGIVMIPIISCSLFALAIFIERLWSMKKENVLPADLFATVERLLKENKVGEALYMCGRNDSCLSRIILTALKSHGRRTSDIKEAIEEAGRREVTLLDKHTGILGTIANISPLLGLLGTVSGMIKAFNVIAAGGVGDPAVLAGGISEALITTASGLTVAIPTFVAYKFLTSRADQLVIDMEEYSLNLVDLLKTEEEVNKKKKKKPAKTAETSSDL